MRLVEIVVLLVALATVVAAFAKRLRVPAPSLLVVVGVLVGLLPETPPVHVPPGVISLVVLPPLLYAASEELTWRDLRTVWRPVAVLAVGLVLASAAAVAAVAAAVASLSLSMAFVLGANLASTEPVAVSALARRLSLPPRPRTRARAGGRSNPGRGQGGATPRRPLRRGRHGRESAAGNLLHGVGGFVILAGGGRAGGGVAAGGVDGAAGSTTSRWLRGAVLTPPLGALPPRAGHVSGVTAVIVAGLAIGARRSAITTAQTRLQLHAVYQTIIFVLESVVFSLIGLELPTLVRGVGNAGHWLVAALAVTVTLIATRVAWVFPGWAITQRRRGTRRPSWPVPAVISWAGTRGVVPLAAALSIPLTDASGAPLPQRDLVLVLTAAAIVISLIVQGFTLEPLARFAGFGRAAADPRHEETVARLRLAEAGLARLDELAEGDAVPDEVIDRLRASLQARIGNTRARLDQGPAAEPGALTERELRGDLIAAENAELTRLFEDGTISAATRQRLQRGLDLELARLTEGQR